MPEKVFMEYNPWWEEEYEPEISIERTSVLEKIEKWLKDKSIIILTGLRRVGILIFLTTSMKMAMNLIFLSINRCWWK